MPQKLSEKVFKKDKEKFRNELKIELLVDYRDYKGILVKYKYKCLKCGYVGKKTYNDLRCGHGCPVCAGNLITEEIFKNDKQRIREDLNVELLINFDEYRGNKIKYSYRCLKCGYKDEKTYGDLKNGYGCPVCAGQKIIEEQFYKDKQKMRDELNLELLIDFNEYKGGETKYLYKCLKCGYEDDKSYNQLKRGVGCPVCKGNLITEEIFKKDKEKFSNELKIELLVDYRDYKGSQIKYPYKCLKCGYEDKKAYYSLKSGRGCPVCAGNLITEEIFKKDKEKMRDKLNVDLLINFDEYKGNHKKYPYRCLKCGYKDGKEYYVMKAGHGCPVCWANSYKSKAEEEIKEHIKSFYDKQIITSDREILKGKELDIYLPDINLAIEFNGVYWHSEKRKSKKYHYNKYIKCKKQNIKLYQIWEDEWRDNQELIKQHIKDLINEEEMYDFSDNYIELDLDLGYDVNKYLNNNYIIKEIKENMMLKDNKHKIYGSGLMILKKQENNNEFDGIRY